MLSGVLIDDQPVSGALPPNLLVDNETDLQPCESGGTVRVPQNARRRLDADRMGQRQRTPIST